MWQHLQTITDYKGKHSCELPSDKSLTDKLNNFYAHNEANNTSKTKSIVFGTKHSLYPKPQLNLVINKVEIERVERTKLLGVTPYCKL